MIPTSFRYPIQGHQNMSLVHKYDYKITVQFHDQFMGSGMLLMITILHIWMHIDLLKIPWMNSFLIENICHTEC